MFQKFITRNPVIVEAFPFTWDRLEEVRALATCRPTTPEQEAEKTVLVVTHLGSRELHVGDYMMRSPSGAWLPVPAAVFEAAYRAVDAEEELDTLSAADHNPSA